MDKKGDLRLNSVTPDISKGLAQLNLSLNEIANCFGYLTLHMSEYKDSKTAAPKIQFLNNLGFDRNSIAAIIGASPETVGVRLSEMKSAKKDVTKNQNGKTPD